MSFERRAQRKHADERFCAQLCERILAVVTERSMGWQEIQQVTGMYFDRKCMQWLRDRELHSMWSQGHLINFAAGLGIRCGYFVEDEAFPAAATAARRAA